MSDELRAAIHLDDSGFQAALKRVEGSSKKTGKAIEKAGEATKGFRSHELVNVSAQLQDIFVSIEGGQDPIRVLIQQGTQLASIFQGSQGGWMNGLKNFGALLWKLTPAALAGASAFGLFWMAVKRSSFQDLQESALKDLTKFNERRRKLLRDEAEKQFKQGLIDQKKFAEISTLISQSQGENPERFLGRAARALTFDKDIKNAKLDAAEAEQKALLQLSLSSIEEERQTLEFAYEDGKISFKKFQDEKLRLLKVSGEEQRKFLEENIQRALKLEEQAVTDVEKVKAKVNTNAAFREVQLLESKLRMEKEAILRNRPDPYGPLGKGNGFTAGSAVAAGLLPAFMASRQSQASSVPQSQAQAQAWAAVPGTPVADAAIEAMKAFGPGIKKVADGIDKINREGISLKPGTTE